jgi:hypothetical protein
MGFISKREEATNPFRRRSTVIKTVFGFWKCKLSPIIKTVNELMEIMWRLAFILANKRIGPIMYSKVPLKGKMQLRIPVNSNAFFTKIISKKQWISNGIFVGMPWQAL